MRDMFKKKGLQECLQSTVLVYPGSLSPTPSASSAMKLHLITYNIQSHACWIKGILLYYSLHDQVILWCLGCTGFSFHMMIYQYKAQVG